MTDTGWRQRIEAQLLTNSKRDPNLTERVKALEAENADLREQLADLRHSMGTLFVMVQPHEHED